MKLLLVWRSTTTYALVFVVIVTVTTASHFSLFPRLELPYDNSNPVIYDNDWTNDYVDWYLMALTSAGEIDYRGIITSSSVSPYNRHMTLESLNRQLEAR